MPLVTLYPETTIPPEFTGMSVVGAATAHEALSDSSDTSYVLIQLSESEPLKWFRGELTNLPVGAGVVTGVVINVRAERTDQPVENHVRLNCGDYPNARLTNILTQDPVDYATGSLTDLDVAECNAAMWMAGGAWVEGPASGKQAWIYKMNFDVTFDYINGVSIAMIFEILGPLVAVGLQELPKLRAELWRRRRLWLHRHELVQVWRDLRAARHRRFVFV